jgi:hypothetical protein
MTPDELAGKGAWMIITGKQMIRASTLLTLDGDFEWRITGTDTWYLHSETPAGWTATHHFIEVRAVRKEL